MVKCHRAAASDLSFYDIFAPQKVPFLKIFDDVIAYDLWFAPPPIENPRYAYHLILTYIKFRSFTQICFAAAHQNVSDEEIMPDYIFYCWQNITVHFCYKYTLVHCLIIHAATSQ